MNILVCLLSDPGKYEHAEEIYRRALGLRETVVGKEHPNTLTSMNNLTGVLSSRNPFSEVDPLYQRALNHYGKTLGPYHPTIEACRRQ